MTRMREKDSSAAGPQPSGIRTVFLAEDSGLVRSVLGEILVTSGYRVFEAGNGEEAMAALERHPGPVDALVTDLQMPGMGGRELADRMREARPGLNVVFISGFTEAASRLAGSLRPGESFLEKPISPAALIRRVREATGEK